MPWVAPGDRDDDLDEEVVGGGAATAGCGGHCDRGRGNVRGPSLGSARFGAPSRQVSVRIVPV